MWDIRRTSDKKTDLVIMPKIVDWDARRDEILAATWRVIARDGIARATIRAIAREAGCSRGILAHYFDDKADILGSALLLEWLARTYRLALCYGEPAILSAAELDEVTAESRRRRYGERRGGHERGRP